MASCTDVVGYVVDGEIYCPDCVSEEDKENTDEVGAVFGSSETDCPSHCANHECEELIREELTSDGVEYVRTKLREFHTRGKGRLRLREDIIAEWEAEWEAPHFDMCSACGSESRWEWGEYREEVVAVSPDGEQTKGEVFYCEDCLEELRRGIDFSRTAVDA